VEPCAQARERKRGILIGHRDSDQGLICVLSIQGGCEEVGLAFPLWNLYYQVLSMSLLLSVSHTQISIYISA
jgi:hypothetical protein